MRAWRFPVAPVGEQRHTHIAQCEASVARSYAADKEALAKVDGVIICTAHSCHASMGGCAAAPLLLRVGG